MACAQLRRCRDESPCAAFAVLMGTPAGSGKIGKGNVRLQLRGYDGFVSRFPGKVHEPTRLARAEERAYLHPLLVCDQVKRPARKDNTITLRFLIWNCYSLQKPRSSCRAVIVSGLVSGHRLCLQYDFHSRKVPLGELNSKSGTAQFFPAELTACVLLCIEFLLIQIRNFQDHRQAGDVV